MGKKRKGPRPIDRQRIHGDAFRLSQTTGENMWEIVACWFAEELQGVSDADGIFKAMAKYGIGFKQY